MQRNVFTFCISEIHSMRNLPMLSMAICVSLRHRMRLPCASLGKDVKTKACRETMKELIRI